MKSCILFNDKAMEKGAVKKRRKNLRMLVGRGCKFHERGSFPPPQFRWNRLNFFLCVFPL